MSEFIDEIRGRLAAAQLSLDEARSASDDYLVQVRQGELESLQRLAAEHEVDSTSP